MSRAGLFAVLLVGGALGFARSAAAGPGTDEPGAPATAPAPAQRSRPASRPSRSAAGEHRFDALRIDGQQRGPAVLEVRGLRSAGRDPLLRLRRSFLNRIFGTIETPALHGQ